MTLHITGPRIYTEDTVLTNGCISVDNGVFTRVAQLDKNQQTQTALSFPSTYHLVPGFIDLHTHGVNGHDVMDATQEALSGISRALAAEGTTAFLATTMTGSPLEIENALLAVNHFMQNEVELAGAEILGVHLEGPFLASSKMGAQRSDERLMPDVTLMQKWEKISGNAIKLVTLAPEEPNGLALVEYLRQQEIIASIGHTNASYAETKTAIAAGCTYATHLFNAMAGIHHREPGTVTAALLSDDVMVELIVDGFHLHPAIVELTLKVKGSDKIVLVTDAMRAKCLQDGCYELGGQDVYVKKGRAQLADGTLAGSVLQIPFALQNMLDFTGCDLQTAVKMASENPARALNIFNRKGSIREGKDADFVILNEDLEVVLTVRNGAIIFSQPATCLN